MEINGKRGEVAIAVGAYRALRPFAEYVLCRSDHALLRQKAVGFSGAPLNGAGDGLGLRAATPVPQSSRIAGLVPRFCLSWSGYCHQAPQIGMHQSIGLLLRHVSP